MSCVQVGGASELAIRRVTWGLGGWCFDDHYVTIKNENVSAHLAVDI